MKKINSNSINYTDNIYYICRTILIIGLPLTIVSGLVLSLPHSSAIVSDSETDSLTLTLSTSCTLSSSIEEAHTASLNGGQYEDGIGITKVNAYCNDNNGYSIYAIGSSNNVDGNTDLISNINDNYNIHTGIYDSSSIAPSSSSTWSMKLTAGVGSGTNTTPPTINNNYSNYNIVPSTYTLVASRASKTDMSIDTSVTGSYFTTTYDIYASSLQPAGTYTGKVKYLMVHPQSNNQHLGFNEVFAMNGKSAINVDGNSHYAMQDMNSTICNTVDLLNEASATQLVDIRDNKLYWVAKLEDGHCWMTQNLDLDIGGANTSTLTSENTDISSNPSTYANDGIYSDYTENGGTYTWNPASTAITSNNTINYNNNTVSSWTDSVNTPYSAEAGDVYYYTSKSAVDDTRYLSLSSCIAGGHTGTECEHYHAGNYYNWTTAVASNNSANLTTQYLVADNSICPKGWRLPIATNGNQSIYEFGDLLYNSNITTAKIGNPVSYKTGGFNNIREPSIWFVRGGNIVYKTTSTSLVSAGAVGFYWSSATSYDLAFNSKEVWQATRDSRNNGMSIRCLAR